MRPHRGGFTADFVREDELPESEPPPLTNIAWRLWHLAVDCFGYYNGKAFGSSGTELVEQQFVGTAEEAVQVLEATTNHFLASWIEIGDHANRPLGPDWGSFAESNYVDLMLHAGRELIHHGAEIGLLRDLYRAQAASEPKAHHAHGLGGVFFRSSDPDATRKWYAQHLGLVIDEFGTSFSWRRDSRPGHHGHTVWSPFDQETDYFGDRNQQFMINFRVDDLDGLLGRLRGEGVAVVDEVDDQPYGRFVHVVDNDGRRVELWEPVDDEYRNMAEALTES